MAKLNNVIKETNPQRDLRNNADAHLKKALNEIRLVGKYAFWKDDNRRSGYVSAYMRRKNVARRKKPLKTDTNEAISKNENH